MIFLQTVVEKSSGIDTTTFLAIVTALGGTVSAIATVLYRHLLSQIAERDKRLAAYEKVPELLERVEQWMAESENAPLDSTSHQQPAPRSRSRQRRRSLE